MHGLAIERFRATSVYDDIERVSIFGMKLSAAKAFTRGGTLPRSMMHDSRTAAAAYVWSILQAFELTSQSLPAVL